MLRAPGQLLFIYLFIFKFLLGAMVLNSFPIAEAVANGKRRAVKGKDSLCLCYENDAFE
jgi:hypothetical protein